MPAVTTLATCEDTGLLEGQDTRDDDEQRGNTQRQGRRAAEERARSLASGASSGRRST